MITNQTFVNVVDGFVMVYIAHVGYIAQGNSNITHRGEVEM
jgi:hypothetical protein